MFASVTHTRDQIQAEIARCYHLSRNQDVMSRTLYASRAKRLWRAAEDVFQGRAYYHEIEQSAARLDRDMRDAPKNAPECTGPNWSDVWRAVSKL